MSASWKNPSEALKTKTNYTSRATCSYRWLKWLFPIVGFISLLWFLIRVIPKPSRAAYPCQRAAFPLASAFIIWLMGIVGSVCALRKARKLFSQSYHLMAIFCVTISIGSLWLTLNITDEKMALADDPNANMPIGQARGIYPGRVVWIHDPNATNWNGTDGHPWEPNNTNLHFVNDMVSRAICELADQPSEDDAWDAIFRYFNVDHGKGDIGYQPGEKITIKVNLTTCNQRNGTVDPCTYDKTSYLDKSDTSPQMITALLGQLVHNVGVEQADIAVGDTLTYFPNQWWDICHTAFPQVCYFDCEGGFGRKKVEFSEVVQHWSHAGDSSGYEIDKLPRCFADADYIINLAVLKGHGVGVTLCAKNHYGSYIRTPDAPGYYDLHASLSGFDPNSGHYRALVDIMAHPHMGGKTLLYMLDGLYGGYYWRGTPYKFEMAPFDDDWPSSLFVSQDPVAIDSVGLDFLWEEWPHVARVAGVDDYLHEAAQADNPPSGTSYDPNGDGTHLQSLGVHEHWNNAIDKQYTRNLGSGDGIELLLFALNNHSPEVSASCEPNIIFSDETVALSGLVSDDGFPGTPGIVTTKWIQVDGPGIVTFGDPNAVNTTATFSYPGTYTLRLTAYDGELTTSSELSVTVLFLGDINMNGNIGIDDLFIFTTNWPNDNCAQSNWCNGADINHSTKVELSDYAIISYNWLKDIEP